MMPLLQKLPWIYACLVIWGALADYTSILISGMAALTALLVAVPRRPHRAVAIAFTIFVLVVHLRWCLLDWVMVDGHSMQPALQPYDVALVQKQGVLPPVTPFLHQEKLARITTPDLRRGDIVVVRYSGLDGPLPSRIVKRVAALAGDNYEFKDNQFFVNGTLERQGIRTAPERLQSAPARPSKAVTALGTLAEYAAAHGCPPRGTVPAGSVLLLGDNAAESRDSRSIGFVPVSFIEGRVIHLSPGGRNVPDAQ
jgi:signal peptidase I